MDTTPFHLILFALDIVVLGGLFLWLRFRRRGRSKRSEVYLYEKSLYVPTASRPPSLIWDVAGICFWGGFGFFCFAVLARLIFTDYVQNNIYHFNVGQCIVEGIAIHGTLFLVVTAAFLYRYRRRSLTLVFGCCGVFLAGASFNALYWEPYHLKIEYYEIKTAKVKTPLRIVFVADIQTDRIGSHEINTLKKIQQQNADLIILGGDYIQTFQGTREKHLPEKFRQMLLDHPLEAPLGVYAIAGNIGDGKVSDAELFRETGIEYFGVSTVFDDLGGAENLGPIDLILLSLGDSWGNVGERGLTESGNFIVIAGHCPNYAIDGYTDPKSGRSLSGYRNAERAPDLMLAGHTHGGQVVIPFYGPIPSTITIPLWGTISLGGDERVRQVPRTMRGGFHKYPNGGHLLVTRGSGLERGWAPRIRVFCPAEISVIDIIPE
jgi:predicted MPP superfamily phosphohydrolase